ncbi:putative baseplate assembly protein [Methanosarcina sp.]|uniref:putative baseplate assembly protein n=1 Tax=Methanosarcina sp. TaxID=2213 RepID=UPI003C723885
MEPKKPILFDQTQLDIYQEALELAKVYCPDLNLSDKGKNYFDPNDPALVILKLFSETTEFLLTQANRIPDKYQLAFLDFIGLKLLPPRPAKVPLTFNLSEGSSGAYVPARTSIASSEDPSVVFETTEDLSVVDMGLEAVYSVNPDKDEYTEHPDALSGKEVFSIFGGDGLEKKIKHILYLGDDILLDIRRKTEVKIDFKGKNLSNEYFSCWFDGNNNPLEIINQTSSGSLRCDFSVTLAIPALEKTSVNGISNFWIAVKAKIAVEPKKDTKIDDSAKLPEISEIGASVSAHDIIPEMVFFNEIAIEPEKGFYPFGEEPKIKDTLYIGSEEVFSKENAKISFNIDVDKKEPNNPTLEWEYWSGSVWKCLDISMSELAVKNFETSGSITFTCPLIPITKINEQENRWIRVRLEKGDYGTAESIEPKNEDKIAEPLANTFLNLLDIKNVPPDKIEKAMKEAFKINKIASEFEYKKADFNPPFIKKIKISYNYMDEDFSRKVIYNNFKFKDIKSESFAPYEVTDDIMPALYLGFNKNLSNIPLSFFFAVKSNLSFEKEELFQEVIWEFLPAGEDRKWTAFNVDDETDTFRREGIISFIIPSNIQNSAEFGKELYWIRAKVTKTKARGLTKTKDIDLEKCPYPKLKGIFPNTVWASNDETIENEVLGSGNGEPGLSLSFSKKPILEGQVIEIKEPIIPSQDELRTIEVESGRDTLRIDTEEGKKIIWVLWTETGDFSNSNSLSRHYVLDRANGVITFGDGIHGMIPPRGGKNIVAKWYQSGGGKKGDVAAEVLTSLKTTIPYIESVTNKVPSSGGEDQENLESAIRRGPRALKNGGRAVTIEDFECLSYEASQYVAKAKCYADKKEDNMYPIKVLIVPKSEEETPYPETGFINLIEEYLKERALITISDKISVQSPNYEKVDVDIFFKRISSAQSDIVENRIRERVKRFLHPLKGGQHGEGWDFGQSIFTSEIAAVVEELEGVDYVTKICLKKRDLNKCGIDTMPMDKYSLPSAGEITVTGE